MRTAQESQEKYLKKSVMAYLEGQPNCTENWILGILKGSSTEMTNKILNSLSAYGDSNRLATLRKRI